MRFALPLSFYLWFLFFVLLPAILFLPLKIRISFDNLRKDSSVSFQLSFYLPGPILIGRFKKNIFIPKIKVASGLTLQSIWKNYWGILTKTRLHKLLFIACRFALASRWKVIDIKIKVGTGEAAWTGLLTGLLRQVAAVVSGYLFQVLSMEQRPRLLVYPSFGPKGFVFSFHVEFYASIISIFYYSTLLFYEAVIRPKNQYLWRMIIYGRSPHTGLDDNRHGKFKGNGRCYQGSGRCSRDS